MNRQEYIGELEKLNHQSFELEIDIENLKLKYLTPVILKRDKQLYYIDEVDVHNFCDELYVTFGLVKPEEK